MKYGIDSWNSLFCQTHVFWQDRRNREKVELAVRKPRIVLKLRLMNMSQMRAYRLVLEKCLFIHLFSFLLLLSSCEETLISELRVCKRVLKRQRKFWERASKILSRLHAILYENKTNSYVRFCGSRLLLSDTK